MPFCDHANHVRLFAIEMTLKPCFLFCCISQGKTFEVAAGSLGFSVVVFTICSLCTLGLLVLRRNVTFFGKAELGGPKGPKYISAIICVCLWVFYVIVACLQDYSIIAGF